MLSLECTPFFDQLIGDPTEYGHIERHSGKSCSPARTIRQRNHYRNRNDANRP